jgi:hydrogenase large subunit
MFVLLHGKYPHPQAIVPGGVSSTITLQVLNEYQAKLGRIFDYAQRLVAIWDDIPEFFYECDERYKLVGSRPMNMVDTGFWDDPYAYDGRYETCNEWGARRWSTPGALIDGELVTTRLTDLNIGIEEFVEHSYYEQWAGDRYATDPMGNPLSPYHAWNKQTLPKPSGRSWKDKYTWACTPRWDRNVVEAGAYVRMFTTAMAQQQPENPFMQATGTSMRMSIPKGFTKAADVEWRVPDTWNAFERNRGRAYHYLFSQLVGMTNLLEAYKLVRAGRHEGGGAQPEGAREGDPEGRAPRRGLLGGRARLADPPPRDGQRQAHELPDQHAVDDQRVPRDPWGQPGPTSRRWRTRRSWRSTARGRSSRPSTCCGRCGPSTRACRAPRTPRRAAGRSWAR